MKSSNLEKEVMSELQQLNYYNSIFDFMIASKSVSNRDLCSLLNFCYGLYSKNDMYN